MAKTDLQQIARETASGKFHPVYFLHGAETMLTREAVETIVARGVEKATADFNYDRFHGADLDLEHFLTTVRTPPMMAPRRVVILLDPEHLPPRGKDLLAEYTEKPVDSTILVLACSDRIRVDQKKKSPAWAARLQQHAATAIFWPLREQEIPGWIVSRAKQAGKRMGPGAAYELYARIGHSLARLADEIEKLSIFCADRPEITAEDIRKMTGVDSGGTVFDWIDALAAGRTLKAISTSSHFLSHGDSAVGAVGMAASHFMTVAQAGCLLDQHLPPSAVTARLGLAGRPQNAIIALLGQARQLSQAQVRRALYLLLDTDRRLKGSSLQDRLILENLAFRFSQEVTG